MSITVALSRNADRLPESVALEFEQYCLTWSELDEIVHRLAAFVSTVVPEGRPLALHMPNCPALTILFLAVARAGREAQVLDPLWPRQLLYTVLERLSDPLLVTSDQEFVDRDRTIFVDSTLGFDEVAEAVAAPAIFHKVTEPIPSQPFFVGFTSGSTGVPKGYRRNHQSWLEGFKGDDDEFGIGEGDVVLAPGPMSHSLAVYALVRGLNAGAKVILCRQFRPNSVTSLIQRRDVTVIYLVPAQLGMILEYAERQHEAPSDRVRLLLSTGSKWPEEDSGRLRRHFPEAEFCEFYGCSELGYLTLAKASEDLPAKSVGRAFPGVSITIRDQSGRKLPARQAGLIFAESPLLFMGYACGGEGDGLKAGNAMSVGDVGFLDEKGFLYLVGRTNRMIICAGKNIHPEEIEEIIRSYPGIAAAVVIGLQDKLRGERLMALLQFRDGQQVQRGEIIRYLRESLPLYKVPRHYGTPQNWPVTQLGKTNFVALQQIGEKGQFDEIA